MPFCVAVAIDDDLLWLCGLGAVKSEVSQSHMATTDAGDDTLSQAAVDNADYTNTRGRPRCITLQLSDVLMTAV